MGRELQGDGKKDPDMHRVVVIPYVHGLSHGLKKR